VNAGTTTTSEPGTAAEVSNAGDGVNAVFDFVIPRGDVGPVGPAGGLLEFDSVAAFPATGTTGQVYLAKDNGDTYRWDADAKALTYVRISERVMSTGIEDSTEIGRAVVTAADARAARASIGAGTPTIVDLREWDSVRVADWLTSPDAVCTQGQSTVTNTSLPFTAADAGKILIVNEKSLSLGVVNRWMTTITGVDAAGVAAVADAAPFTATGVRAQWGFDGTDAINAALAEVSALAYSSGGNRDVYLHGTYRATQIVVPHRVSLRGGGWGSMSAEYPDWDGTVLHQLPGSEKDFIVFEGSSTFVGPQVLSDINVVGPERNVIGKPWTLGSGLAFRRVDGTALTPQDGAYFTRLHFAGFPEHGIDLPNGGVPFTLDQCRVFYNGGCGVKYQSANSSRTQGVHFQNVSGDGNRLGLLYFQTVGRLGSIVVTNLKSEAAPAGSNIPQSGFQLAEDCQMSAIVFDECDGTPVIVNGVTHILGGASKGAGPAILIKSATNKRPRVMFNAVANRVTGSETGPTTDAVTLRDQVAGVDIPRTTVSGHWPLDARDSTVIDSAFTVVDDLDNTKRFNFNAADIATGTTRAYVMPNANTTLVGTDVAQTLKLKYLVDPNVQAAAGASAIIRASGPDTDHSLSTYSKGNGATFIRNGSGKSIGIFHSTNIPADQVNGISFYGSAAGSAVRVVPNGTDTACNLALEGKGLTGVVTASGTQVEVKGHTHTVAQVAGALSWATAPANAAAPGTAGQIAYDANGYLYLCIASGNWVRTQLTTWT
jgi:hypothetical protein